MRRKLQIFVSSTYTDMRDERQAAVEAILKAGHIPAGMELFAAGSKSQWETITRWIDESDVLLLILGGRYGSLEPTSKKSYIQLEYEYAVEKNLPVFSVIATEASLDKKVRKAGKNALETENSAALTSFRKQTLTRMCSFFSEPKDIKLSVHETIADLIATNTFSGWVSGRDVQNHDQLVNDFATLSRENATLRKAAEDARLQVEQLRSKSTGATRSFEQLLDILSATTVPVPAELAKTKERLSLLDIFYNSRHAIANGVSNQAGTSDWETFVFYKVAVPLKIYGLTEETKVQGARWQRLQTTRAGNEFIAQVEINELAADRAKQAAAQPKKR